MAPPSESVADPSLLAAHDRTCPEPTPAEEVLALFDECGPALTRYVTTFGIGADEAEDILQDTFLALFRHLERGRPRINLRGWLFRVAENQARRRRNRARWRSPVTGAEEAALSTRLDPAPSPEVRLIRAEQEARARAVLLALPDRDRRCLLLRSHGLGYRDIAGLLGISLGSVAKSLTRSIARFVSANGG